MARSQAERFALKRVILQYGVEASGKTCSESVLARRSLTLGPSWTECFNTALCRALGREPSKGYSEFPHLQQRPDTRVNCVNVAYLNRAGPREICSRLTIGQACTHKSNHFVVAAYWTRPERCCFPLSELVFSPELTNRCVVGRHLSLLPTSLLVAGFYANETNPVSPVPLTRYVLLCRNIESVGRAIACLQRQDPAVCTLNRQRTILASCGKGPQ